jgi:hypothetical protein
MNFLHKYHAKKSLASPLVSTYIKNYYQTIDWSWIACLRRESRPRRAGRGR